MFNVRVYGFLLDKNEDSILVVDEWVKSKVITKLPGGGLRFGEGTIDCLKRELMEEANLLVEVVEHIYTTDFFQPSMFNDKEQVLSIYYKMIPYQFDKLKKVPTSVVANEIKKLKAEKMIFRFLPIQEITLKSFSLPIDKKAISVFLQTLNGLL